MSNRDLDILFLTNIPSPYQVDFFTELQRVRPGTFHVIFSAARERDRLFDKPSNLSFSCDVLESNGRNWLKDWHHNRSLRSHIAQFDAKLFVIGGSYLMPDARVMRRAAMDRNIPWLFWGEYLHKRGSRGIRARARAMYASMFLRSAAGAIGIGSTAAAEYAALMPGKPVANIPYAPALQRLLSPSAQSIEAAAELRRRLFGTADAIVILFCGSLSERKAPDLLLESFYNLCRPFPDARLLLVGDGPTRAALESATNAAQLTDLVRFTGFLQGDALDAAYLAANIFVLPSRGHEGWGVVVQEAMAAGLPVVVSQRVGAGADLVKPGENGFIIGDRAALDDALRALCADQTLRLRLGARSRAIVQNTTAPVGVAHFLDFADKVVKGITLE